MALYGNYVLYSSEFIIENGMLKPTGNMRHKPLNIEKDYRFIDDIDNKPAYIEFMNIQHEDDLIPFALKRGIPGRCFRPNITEPMRHYEDIESAEYAIETNLLLNDAKLMRWLVRLSKFLRGELKQDEDCYPTEETIQHICNNFVDYSEINSNLQHLVDLQPEHRLDFAINQLNETIGEEIYLSGEKLKLTPEAYEFASEILTDISRYVCKSIYRAPNFHNDGTAFWSIYETSLISRLFYELLEKLIAPNEFIHICVCGRYFTGGKNKSYCSTTCKKRENMRTFRSEKDKVKSPRGRKRKEKAGV